MKLQNQTARWKVEPDLKQRAGWVQENGQVQAATGGLANRQVGRVNSRGPRQVRVLSP